LVKMISGSTTSAGANGGQRKKGENVKKNAKGRGDRGALHRLKALVRMKKGRQEKMQIVSGARALQSATVHE